MFKQLYEQPRGEGSNTTKQSAAKIQEQSEASDRNQLIVCDDFD